MPPRTVADIATIACRGLSRDAAAGQVNEPPVSCSRPSMVVRLRATGPGRGEAVSQPDGSFDHGRAEADRVSAGIVQLRAARHEAAERGAAEVDLPAARPQAIEVDVAVDSHRASADQGQVLRLAHRAVQRESPVNDRAGQLERAFDGRGLI